MKKFHLIAAVVLAVLALSSCTNTDYKNVIPANAPLVMEVDIRSIAEKSEFKQSKSRQELEKSLSEVFPESQFTIRLMQFANKHCEKEGECISFGNCAEKFCYKRDMNAYDFFQTNWEWSFLDEVQTPYKKKYRHSWRYKLWKHLCR